MRIECTPAERGIWVDLLSLASKDDGHIRANEDTPYPLQQLSGMLLIPEDELEAAIQKFIKTKKLIKEKTGTLYIATWDKYQFTDRHKRRILDSQGDYFSPKYETFAPCPEKYKSMATKKGLVRVSRLIVAIAINRSLKPAEQVHHIDGNDKNDTVENLMLFKGQREHLRYQHGYEAECIWRGDYLGSDEIKAISVKIKDAILYNNKLNNNKLNNKTVALLLQVKGIGKEKAKKLTDFICEELVKEFPEVDVIEQVKKKCAWWRDNPITKKSNLHSQMRNWFKKSQQFLDEAKKGHSVGATPKRKPHPKEKELQRLLEEAEQKIRKENPDKKGEELEVIIRNARGKISQDFWKET